MKIAVTSQGTDLSSQVDPRFGRAKQFAVIDTDTGEWKIHDNSINLNAVQGAGIQAGRKVVDLGVDAVITGNVGPKAFATLQSANITVYSGAAGTVQQAIDKCVAGELQVAERADVEGHWA